jgi:hypothetical protein
VRKGGQIETRERKTNEEGKEEKKKERERKTEEEVDPGMTAVMRWNYILELGRNLFYIAYI